MTKEEQETRLKTMRVKPKEDLGSENINKAGIVKGNQKNKRC
jgi:hypothetical protein